ncbi:STARD3 N-terminal-like protein isoform X2 [Latimeria chalumnae]|uniref:STARD3 N-terminal-like protein isoform X2 n=1 Tax=Latimeria chalumnae TaxID=7897 RepID=UPI0003C11B1F|nr:PREDICTED: MLN64 N-terminal domain homolog isoform X2 [Latimeria chalumnae]|eukprot:XP_006010704.1 PREDICTED: MLN64 N-terminal domain homolog isoform X2 [Latimeria chalumnae]
MSSLPVATENAERDSLDSRASPHNVPTLNPAQLAARLESYEGATKKSISDVRRTFCLFVTFDLLFIALLWIIELNVLAVFRFTILILAYAVFKLRHWWAIAFTTAVSSAFLIAKVIVSKLFSQGAFGYVLPIMSFLIAWIETWFLDFKVLPQEAEDEYRLLAAQDASERAALIQPGPLSDGQFYSPPESIAESEDETEEKCDSEKPIV